MFDICIGWWFKYDFCIFVDCDVIFVIWMFFVEVVIVKYDVIICVGSCVIC